MNLSRPLKLEFDSKFTRLVLHNDAFYNQIGRDTSLEILVGSQQRLFGRLSDISNKIHIGCNMSLKKYEFI